MKRAQGLSIETIIIATLLIAVLVIVLFMVTKHNLAFNKGTSDCVSNGGNCVSSTADCISQGGQPLDFICPKATPACCKIS
jgi:hypothetical protein